MAETITEKPGNITLSAKDYQVLLEAYQKLGEFLIANKKKKKITPSLKTLYGIWKGVKVDEQDFEKAEKSLFKTSL